MYYVKTTAGQEALQQRSKQLSAKQRQLLFLMGTDDFDKLPAASRQRLFQPEVIDHLLELGFIINSTPETETETETETIAAAIPTVNVLSQVLQRYSQPRAKPTLAEEIAEEEQQAAFKLDMTPPPDPDTALNFPAIKGLMIDTLRQYGGLLARGLIEKIDKCENTSELKRCHMAWVTLLQETRLPAKQLHSQVKHLQKFYHLHETETNQ
ncbi:hypothetical protein [Acinetobacter sp. ANC 5502]